MNAPTEQVQSRPATQSSSPRPTPTTNETDLTAEALLADPVPAQSRMISGIDLIDFSVGGLTPERLYVVKGGIGMGKTIVGLQFLSRGLELGEPGILITDQKPSHVLEQARSIGFALDEAVKREQLLILNPSQRYFELVESPADVAAIIEELGEYARQRSAKRLVIDPVYALVNTSYSSHFALSVTQSLVNALEPIGLTTLLIASDDESPELTPVLHMLEQNSYGVIGLSPDRTTGGRLMRLSKLRSASTDHLASHYRILDGRGLINYRGDGETVTDVTKPWETPAELNRSVLLLGANPETISRVREALGEEYQLAAESDLTQGIARARAEQFGLVLVSPSRSVESIAAILDLARNSSSSIAFLSPAGNRASDKVLYLRAGADDFITEPFSKAEIRARVDALVRRSGRRLIDRDSAIAAVTPDEIRELSRPVAEKPLQKKDSIRLRQDEVSFAPDLDERLRRSIDTASRLDMEFAVYWLKGQPEDKTLNRSLAELCRREDILCHNSRGEFVAILTATDENGVRGFESRLDEKLGDKLQKGVRRGYAVHRPGEPLDTLNQNLITRSQA